MAPTRSLSFRTRDSLTARHGAPRSHALRHPEAPRDLAGWSILADRQAYDESTPDGRDGLVECTLECVVSTDGRLVSRVHSIWCAPGFPEDAPVVRNRLVQAQTLAEFLAGYREALREVFGAESALRTALAQQMAGALERHHLA